MRAMGHSLHNSVDGRGLADCRDAGWVNAWMVNGSALLTGRSYIGCIALPCGPSHQSNSDQLLSPDRQHFVIEFASSFQIDRIQ